MTDIDPRAVTLFGVKLRGGIWQITRDGQFYGHYMSGQRAFEAAEAAARSAVAGGGAADVRWNDRLRRAVASDRTRGLDVAAIGAMRTMEFRAGSIRVVP